MSPEDAKVALEAAIENSYVETSSDGSHLSVLVVSPAFEGLNAVKKQQLVYGCLQAAISSGAVHAVHMKTFTPEEWDAQKA